MAALFNGNVPAVTLPDRERTVQSLGILYNDFYHLYSRGSALILLVSRPVFASHCRLSQFICKYDAGKSKANVEENFFSQLNLNHTVVYIKLFPQSFLGMLFLWCNARSSAFFLFWPSVPPALQMRGLLAGRGNLKTAVQRGMCSFLAVQGQHYKSLIANRLLIGRKSATRSPADVLSEEVQTYEAFRISVSATTSICMRPRKLLHTQIIAGWPGNFANYCTGICASFRRKFRVSTLDMFSANHYFKHII